MFKLFNSNSKRTILEYLSKSSNKTAKEISESTKINYKNAYKVLTEFVELKMVFKKNNKYSLTSEFIEYIRKLSDNMSDTYINDLYIRNKVDLYNAMITLSNGDKMTLQVNQLIDKWLTQRLDDWYSKFYDPENKEYKKIEKIIKSKFKDNKINILEVGCGTGRISKQLSKKYPKLISIDSNEKYIDYCKQKYKADKIKFIHSDIKDFKYKEKFDVIIFSWIGLHFQENIDSIIKNLKQLIEKEGIIIIIDAYTDTEYVKILQMIRKIDLSVDKVKKQELNELLMKEFGNLNQEVLLTEYKFDNMKSVIDNFKIELTLEESHIWTKEDEDKLKKYLLKKKDSLIIEEGMWVSVVKVI